MAETGNDTGVIKGKNSKKKIIVTAMAVSACFIVVFAVIKVYTSPARQLQRQLDLGRRYLEELDYEQAIVVFDRAIEIDPMNADAYLGKAEACAGLEDYAMAAETLEEGYQAAEDEAIKDRLLSLYTQMAGEETETDLYGERNAAYGRSVESGGENEEIRERLEELQRAGSREGDAAQAGEWEGGELPYYELGFSPEDFTLAGYSVMDGDHLADIRRTAAEKMPEWQELLGNGKWFDNEWAWTDDDVCLYIDYYPLAVYPVGYAVDGNISMWIDSVYPGFLEEQNTNYPLYAGKVTPDTVFFEDAIDILRIREVIREIDKQEKFIEYDTIEVYDEELDDYLILDEYPVEQFSDFVFYSQYGYTECIEQITSDGYDDYYSYAIITEGWELDLYFDNAGWLDGIFISTIEN